MQQVTIVDVSALVIPAECVVCGDGNAEFVPYEQESFPVIAPLFGVTRSLPVELPYCEWHYTAFRRRFQLLKLAQFLIAAGIVATAFAGEIQFLPPLPPPYSSLVVLGLVLLFVLTWVVKGRLYDVWFKSTFGGLTLQSSHTSFIESLRRANHGNTD